MYNTIIYLIFIVLLLSCLSCKDVVKEEHAAYKLRYPSSPLDSILGDKILDIDSVKIRNNNFESLLQISEKALLIPSRMYRVGRLSENNFVFSQRKKYLEARNFDLLLKTKDSFVVDYHVFNDFKIVDVEHSLNSWLVLLSDCDQTNIYWKRKYVVRIVQLDNEFNEIWSHTLKCRYALDGDQIKTLENGNYSVQIRVITGCEICYTVAELIYTPSGILSEVYYVEAQNGSYLSEEELNELFLQK